MTGPDLPPESPLHTDTQRGLGGDAPPLEWNNPLRWPYNVGQLAKAVTPRGLLPRAILIIVTPIILLQALLAVIFYDRHLDRVTKRLAMAVANDLGAIIELHNQGTDPEFLRDLAARNFDLKLTFAPNEILPPAAPPAWFRFDTLYAISKDQLTEHTGRDNRIEIYASERAAMFLIALHDGSVLRAEVPHTRLTSNTAYIFMLWMVGLSLALLIIAFLFLRNQVRPIRELAIAADRFGRGLDAPGFKPHGAHEVRRTARAFITMKQRIERQINQRTAMLAGISHDLRTPIARIKLELAMMEKPERFNDMRGDLNLMERMLDEYLAFARGLAADEPEETELKSFVEATVRDAHREDKQVDFDADGADTLIVPIRQTTMRRCLTNLINNAVNYGTRAHVELKVGAKFVEISIEDDGPGIPADRIEDAFRPFSRLDEGRNLDSGGGVGLGLAVARDAARGHGGDVLLDKSRYGGLKATIRLPLEHSQRAPHAR